MPGLRIKFWSAGPRPNQTASLVRLLGCDLRGVLEGVGDCVIVGEHGACLLRPVPGDLAKGRTRGSKVIPLEASVDRLMRDGWGADRACGAEQGLPRAWGLRRAR